MLFRSRAVIVVVALAVAGSLALPWAAAKEVDLAAANWPANPTQAFDRIRVARSLNPLSDRPDITAGIIAERLGDERRARAAFAQAVVRNPENWYAHLELGLLHASAHDPRAALAAIHRARALNPREPLLARVESDLRDGKPVAAASVRRELVDRLRVLVGKSQQ